MNKHRHHSMSAFLSYLRKYKFQLGIVLFWFIIANSSLAIIPVYIGKLVGALASPPIDRHEVLVYVWILIASSSVHDITWRVGEYCYMKLLKPIGFSFESIVFREVINKPYPYFVDKFTGKLSSYINTLGEELRTFIDDICYNYTNEVIKLIAVIIILISVNWYTGLIFLVGLILMAIVGKYTVRNSIKYEKKFADVQSSKNGKLVDAIANFVNIKSFQTEHIESLRIDHEQSKTLTASNQAFAWGMVFWGSMSFFVRQLIWPATILLNVYLFMNGRLTVEQLTTFLSAILLFSGFIWEIIWYVTRYNIKLARIEEAYVHLFGKVNIINDYFDAKETQPTMPVFNKDIEINTLNFAYPDKKDTKILTNLNIVLRKGEKIGIVGKSGSGKTTITKLLLGYYSAKPDEIFLDGTATTTKQLSQLISYVPQDTTLFHRTIAENIGYATTRKVTRQDIVDAAKQAHAHEFISQITDEYEARVGERGVKLSAGQRQRIAIARAFLDDKPILVLDEATSALDSESEVFVQEALEALWQNKTVIAIAHRLSTLRHMDRIIVIDKGMIVENGSHADLLKHKGKYAALWAHQSGGFLLED